MNQTSDQPAKARWTTHLWVSCVIVLLAWLLNKQFFLWPIERMLEIDVQIRGQPGPGGAESELRDIGRWTVYWLTRHPLGMLINMLVIANTLLAMRAVLPRWYWKVTGGIFAVGAVCSVLFGSISVLTVSLTIMFVVLVLALLPGTRYYYVDARTGAYKGEAHDIHNAQRQGRDETIIAVLIAYVPFIALGLLTHVVTFLGVF